MSETQPTEHRSAFISHSSPDDGYVAELESLVRAMGYDEVFNDVHAIKPDDQFWPKIEKGITACDTLMVVITTASLKSPWVLKEVELARSLEKRVVPIWIEDCKIPPTFADRDVIDFRPKSRIKDRKIAGSRILRHAPAILFGREKWLAALDEAWAKEHLNLYTLVAWGGVGKTSLVAHWVSRLMARGWPGVARYFDWSFYSQGTSESRQTSADLFINEALKFFGDPDPTVGDPWARGERLAQLIRKQRTLLVLDGIEPLQFPPTDRSGQAGRLKDPALEALVQNLAADNPGLCIITTREHLKNVEALPTTAEKKLDKLLKEAAISLLRHLQVVGTEEELEEAWKDAGGHALTLQLLGRFIADAYPDDRDIRHYKQIHIAEADQERQGRSAFKVMIAYEKWFKSAGEEQQRELEILRLTGLFDRPITIDCLKALRARPAIPSLTDAVVKLSEREWNLAVKRLTDIDLLSRSGTGADVALDAHPLVREYFADQLQKDSPEAFRAAHSRLFDHLCETTKPHQPVTLEGLAPLYQAIVHGCLAGRQQEACVKVYRDRILRGTDHRGFYSTRQLGAIGVDLGAVAGFFNEPWSRVSPNLPESFQAWLLNEAAYRLRALGRLTEAVEPLQVGLKMREDSANWDGAARQANNLSELELTLGRLEAAVADSQRAVEFADRSEDAFLRMASRDTAADALHQSGRRTESEALFAEAERMQAEYQPEFPLLYSLSGFQYVDLLLLPAERAAWQAVLRTRPHAPAESACAEAERRCKKWFEWRMPSDSLHSVALENLTLARAHLYRAILSANKSDTSALSSEIRTALTKLRQANLLDDLPKALLTAAFYFGTLGKQPEEARRYLNEAQQIAERGPMPLYLADVHLHRARLFRDVEELKKARVLIEKHGYWRRKEELEDAEAALLPNG